MHNIDNIYKQLFDESLDAKVLLDIEANKFLLCNQKACELYGYTQEEFLNISPYELSIEFKNNNEMENKQESIISQGWDKFFTKHKNKNNEPLDIYVKSKKLFFENKTLLSITLIEINDHNPVVKLLKKQLNPNSPYIEIQESLKWDKNSSTLFFNERKIKLTLNEEKLIKLLITNINATVPYEAIYSYFEDENITYNSLCSLIKRIRKKTTNKFITTNYSLGFSINQIN